LEFKDLHIGQTFDFVDPDNITYNSFFMPCKKLSATRYVDTNWDEHKIGSVKAKVFHVNEYSF
jgi:hypothetical protein